MLKTKRIDSPQAYLIALQNQKVEYRNRSQSQFTDFSNKNQVRPINQKPLTDYSPYDICIQKGNVTSKQLRSSSLQNSSQYLQETSDKTHRDQDSDGSFNSLIKFLESQKCFEYSRQVKCLLNTMNKLKEENKKLKKKQLDVISLLSQSANSFQSPFRENSQNQVNQKQILSSPKNLVDDNEESNTKGSYQKDPLRKNLFQTFDSPSQISPIQNNNIKSPESCFSNPFSQSSIEKEVKNENIYQPNLNNLQQKNNQIIASVTNFQNNFQKYKQNKINKLHQQNCKNSQNRLNKQQVQNKSQSQQTNKNQQKQIIKVSIQHKDTSQYKQVSDIISQSQYNQQFQFHNASSDIGRRTASFLDPIFIQPSQTNQTANLKNHSKKTVIKLFNGIKDSLKLQKKTYCKSNSPQRSRKSNNIENKSQPRKNFN
ncbi:hypothetical protein ABPG72_007004 [Tetrahymena utriculariae]